MVSTQQLEEGNIANLIFKFSGPAVLGMIVMSIYNVVDRIFIGHGVGFLGLAGITVGYPLVVIVLAVTLLVGIGATALISIRLGEQRKDDAEKVMGNAMTLLVLIALALTILGLLFLDPLLVRFGASATVLPYARAYMRIILLGSVFQVIGFGVNNFIRAEGNPKVAMLTMVAGSVLNIILDAIFILVLGLGVAGAAIATVMSQAASAAFVLLYFIKGDSLLKFHPANFRLELPLSLQIFSVGMPAFLKQVATALIVIILNNSLLHYGGDIAISAFGVIHSMLILLLMPIFGISQGIQPVIGYNYGAKKFQRVKEALNLGVLIATAIVVVGFVVVQAFPAQIIQLFTRDEELIHLAAQGLRTFLIFLPIIGFQIVGANYFQAVGKPRQAVFLNLSRQVLLFIPALLILPRHFGLMGIWMVAPVADFFSTALTAVFVQTELRYLDKKEKEFDLQPQYES